MLTLVLVHFELGSCSDFIPTDGKISRPSWALWVWQTGREIRCICKRLVGPRQQSVQVVCSRGDKCWHGCCPLIEMPVCPCSAPCLPLFFSMLCSLWCWPLDDCQRFANCLTFVCPVSNQAAGFLEVSLVSVSLACCLSWSDLACRLWRAKCANRGMTCVFVVEASVLPNSRLHQIVVANGQIIGATYVVPSQYVLWGRAPCTYEQYGAVW